MLFNRSDFLKAVMTEFLGNHPDMELELFRLLGTRAIEVEEGRLNEFTYTQCHLKRLAERTVDLNARMANASMGKIG